MVGDALTANSAAADDGERRAGDVNPAGPRYAACSWPHLSRMGLSVGVLRISPRRCRWDRGRVRRGGRRVRVRAPVGRSGGSEDCGRASTESRSCWRRCSAGGGSESWSIRVRSLRARGARRSMIVRYRGASLHSTRTWWRACSGTGRCTTVACVRRRVLAGPSELAAVGSLCCGAECVKGGVESLLAAPVGFVVGLWSRSPEKGGQGRFQWPRA
jgi:hypothetical protein